MDYAITSDGSRHTVTAYLEVVGDETGKPTVFSLHDEAVIGRDPQDSLGSDKFLCIPDHTVSRRHARVRRRGDVYFVEDLHSSNGTFVMGKRIKPGVWHPLRDGAEFSVASAQIDPYLDALVAKSIQSNIDLKILAARIRVAGAQIGEARAGALPTLNAGAGASFEKSTGQKFSKQFNLATQVNWDIDIWGKVDKGVQAQTAGYSATEADWRAGYLNLVSGVSTTYFQILQLDRSKN